MKKLLVTCGIIALSCVSAHAQVLPTPGSLSSLLSSTPWTNGQGKITGQTLQGIHTLEQQILNGMGTWDANGNYASINLTGGTYNAGGVARAFGFEPTSTITVPNLQELDAIRISGSFVVGVSSGTGVGGQFAGMNFQETLAPGSDRSANLYGVIGQVINNGAGSVKAIYGRANCSNVQSDPTYSTCIAGVFNVNTGTNQNFAANIQMNAVTNLSGKPVNDGMWLSTANTDGSPALYNYGVLLDQVAIQAGGAAFQARAFGPGDFAVLKSQSASANLFEVNASGDVGVGLSAGGLNYGEALTVYGPATALIATGGGENNASRGLFGDAGGGTVLIASMNTSNLEFRYNNVSVGSWNAAGLTIGTFGTGLSSPNGVQIGQSTITRTAAGGNLAIGAGSGSGSLLNFTGGTIALSSNLVQLPLLPTSPPSGTSAGHVCRDTNGTIYGCT